MSPRSDEFMEEARDRLQAAMLTFENGFFASVISLAYYATLYAARAALSEEDMYTKTHKGTWLLLRQTFADTGRLDSGLVTRAAGRQRLREDADYDARHVTQDEARAALDEARAFVHAVDELFGT